MINDEVRESLITKLNLSHLSREEQDDILNALQENILAQINVSILNRLTAEEIEEVNAFAEAKEVDSYLKNKIPDLTDLIEKSAKDIVSEFQTLVTA